MAVSKNLINSFYGIKYLQNVSACSNFNYIPNDFFINLKFSTFGHSVGLQNQIHLGLLSYPVIILGIMFVTKTFNLIDGSDGITAGLALLALIGINLVHIISGGCSFNLLSIVLLSSLIPYLWFNLTKSSKSKIF